MKNLTVGVLLSAGLHVLIFIACYFYRLTLSDWRLWEVSFLEDMTTQQPQRTPPASDTFTPQKTLALRTMAKEPPANECENGESLTDTLPQPVREENRLGYFAPATYSKFWLRSDSFHLVFVDSQQILSQRALPFSSPDVPLTKYDRLEDQLFQRHHGHPPLLPLDAIKDAAAVALKSVERKSSPKPIHLSSLPTAAEIAALATIYHLHQPTQVEIYAQMDSSIRLTAQDLDAVLTKLTEKGFVERKLISPRDELTMITPVGKISIEKSARNRRNRVYRYQSVLERDHLMNFLQAQYYQEKERGAHQTAASIEKLIILLARL